MSFVSHLRNARQKAHPDLIPPTLQCNDSLPVAHRGPTSAYALHPCFYFGIILRGDLRLWMGNEQLLLSRVVSRWMGGGGEEEEGQPSSVRVALS